jgi:transcriptional regulator with XRE-family HTH domain
MVMGFMSECIKENRSICKMSLQEVADAAGLTKAHVWELEQGRCINPTIKSILGVATALRVDPSMLASLAMADLRR